MMKIEELRSRITPLTKKEQYYKSHPNHQVTILKSILMKMMKISFNSQLIGIKTQKGNILYFMMGR